MHQATGVKGHAPWRDDELLECAMVVPETPNVATFCFRAPSDAWFDYAPGQFLTLELPLPDGPVHRTYTISSSPSRPLSISVTIKAQPGSIGSRWMLDNLRPGMKLKAFGPAGVFSFQNHPSDKYLFISAGSGITPMMSMTTWFFDLGVASDIVFINCARRPSEIVFRERLDHMASRVPGIKLKFVVEQSDEYKAWTGYEGMFNQLMLGLMAPDYLEREVFCCGPEPFMRAVSGFLADIGFDMDRYHQESFHAPALTEAEAEARTPEIEAPEEGAVAHVRFARSDVEVDCAETDTVLAVAKAAGLNIPSGCTFGLCGTCKVKKKAGDVLMVHNGGISEEDIEEGYILACCSNPVGTVEIDI